MLGFSIGQRVMLHRDGHPPLSGGIAKYNRKTVTVIPAAGQRWNGPPAPLRAS